MKSVTRVMGIVLALGSSLVVVSSLPYLLPGLRHPFLLERLARSLDAWWLVTLRVHVAGGVSCLPAGLVLIARGSRDRWPTLHRMLGRGYASLVLLVMVPSGIYLAPYSKFGWASGSGFVASAVILAVATSVTVLAGCRGDERRHRAAALHSYAQVASAVSFRAYHLAFQLVGLSYETNYIASVWLSAVGNAAVAELWIRYTTERSHHETSRSPERSVFGLLTAR